MCGSRCTCRGSSPSRSARESSCLHPFLFEIHVLALFGQRPIAPVDLLHLADDEKLVPVRAHGAVIIEAVAELSRSEEHTSELQSLMRISYAVFCLKKTNTQKTNHQQAANQIY